MTDEEYADWLTAVVDAQVELSRETFESEEEKDECWGFFRFWRDDITGAYWDQFCEGST